VTFFPVPDEFYADPQFIPASDAAIVLWARAGSWSAHHLTDGHVPAGALLGFHKDGPAAAEELVQLRVWKRARGGYQYVVWPPHASRAYVEAKREGNRVRQQKKRRSEVI